MENQPNAVGYYTGGCNPRSTKKKKKNNNEWFLKKTTRDWPNDGLLRIKKHIQNKQKNEMRKEKQRSTGGLFLKIQGGRD